MKWTKLSALLMELFRLRVQLSTITMRLLWQRSPCRLPKDLMWPDFTLSNPSADTSYTCSTTNGTAGSAVP
jgi:hypothetical protein